VIGEDFATVLAAAQTGADWAVAALYRDLHPAVLAFMAVRAGGEAEDLASEVFITVAQGLTRFEGDERGLRSWVFAIAYRKVGESWRATKRRRTEPVPFPEVTSRLPAGDAEAEALDSLSTAEALAMIASLGSPQAEVVLLRVVADLSVEEVATIVGKRPGAVRALQHRALIRLGREFFPELRNADGLAGHDLVDDPTPRPRR
jgi:RNA polymerase sigma-70 factor (ECF subfamily)